MQIEIPSEPLKQLIASNVALLGAFIARGLWRMARRDGRKLGQLTKDVAEIKGSMTAVLKAAEEFPKLKRDVDAAHAGIRELKGTRRPADVLQPSL